MANKNNSKALVPQSIINRVDAYFQAGLEQQEAEEVQDPTAFRLSIARQRYKEGFTDKDKFTEELRALQCPENQIGLEIIAGDLQAGYDYTMDLIATWRDAFRKGNIDIATFGELIASVVVVPERSQTYVARELARIKPEAGATLEPSPQAYYETDAGKIDVDSIRRLRRKLRMSKDQEILALQELGMPEDLARATADNDDARLSEKGEEE